MKNHIKKLRREVVNRRVRFTEKSVMAASARAESAEVVSEPDFIP